MSRPLSFREDSFKLDDPISNLSERVSKKEQIEMKRQLDIMLNRIKLLSIQKSRLQAKQQQTEDRIQYLNNIRSYNHSHFERVLSIYLVGSTKQGDEKLISATLKGYQKIKLQQQIRLSIQQQREQKFQQMKLQSLQYDKFITLQRERSKSFNVEKKHKVQLQEQQIQQNLEQFKQIKQQQFKSQHKQVVLNNYLQKANDFVKINKLWDLEKSILNSLRSSTKSKFKISLTKA
ncbi:unnamed protein product (macronuclear) [Paramecium tetraurelia]|uniref:Uncharacterized protein n=1 Tax=Paramecium tetraurelia TaxID=5888 RepID=A0EFF0_PARTE|nr:uncharacterized protein GSPATT00026364001 [Paramecium tetraurelia]CAK94041.1 unnamed protein product [Paramecium tetraurelia]|eukprot:XP_001461414.1 hypothetical protein (macronuclear) [Paramecium tetraurelia strain d4-2]